jgi:hypothetical protein
MKISSRKFSNCVKSSLSCNPIKWLKPVLMLPILLNFVPMIAIAQTARTPDPDANGNYTTAVLQGNRGNTYPNKKWLVVDPDPTYLNCRVRPNGEVRSRIPPGEAIVNQDGSFWLRIGGTDPLIIPPIGGGSLGTCFVRANRQFIAPINGESISEGGALNP